MDLIIFAFVLISLFCLSLYINHNMQPTYTPKKQEPQHREQTYRQWKSRLVEEIEYSKINPWRKDAKVIPFPIDRVRRPSNIIPFPKKDDKK